MDYIMKIQVEAEWDFNGLCLGLPLIHPILVLLFEKCAVLGCYGSHLRFAGLF
jgi:hypothetical protein